MTKKRQATAKVEEVMTSWINRRSMTFLGVVRSTVWVCGSALLGSGLLVGSGLLNAQVAAGTAPESTFGKTIDRTQMAERVKQEYLHAWTGYRTAAWGHDELMPLSGKAHDWYGVSLHMTEIDGLDTMLLMGLTKEAQEAQADLDKNLSFDQDIYVKNFEITIRCLGGLESAYEISGDKRLLALAQDLGDRLLPAFRSPTGIPYPFVNLKTGKVKGVETDPASSALLPEFGTLSRLTGKPVYYDAAKRAMLAVWKRRSSVGLLGGTINVETGKWTDTTATVGSGTDSFYEYALKCWLLFGDKDMQTMWEQAKGPINQYLADEVRSGFWYGEAEMTTGQRRTQNYGALDAFFPALLALDGDMSRAQRLQQSNFQMWTAYGIEPEVMNYTTFEVSDAGYQLRPEMIESTYYLHHLTGDPLYEHMGQMYYDSLVRWCRTPNAYAALSDVRTKTQKDDMESFFFAETLKYLYLLYAPDATVDWKHTVFNTEAHPLKRFD
jgi:mannosidase alpha-like ER degradation enhancer 2